MTYHYKDRKPEETIQIIENFFTSRNCVLKCELAHHSEADTYSCSYGVYWHNRRIHGANGKGISEAYAKASCYAELYERFCMYARSANMNKFILNGIMEKNQETYSYYCDKDEKELTYTDLLEEPFTINVLEQLLPVANKKFINTYIDTFCDGKCIGSAYHSLCEDKIEYKHLPTITAFYGSTGFAAGNTLEEAIVQASSEIFERYTIQLFYTTLEDHYYFIEEQYLPQSVKKYIDNLHQSNPGLDVKLYDLSYNFHLPVCLLIITDRTNHIFYLNFGASPLFEIAAERCFTEIYQGSSILPNQLKIIKRPIDVLAENACLDAYKSTHIHEEIIIPEGIILNSTPVNSYNKDIFLFGDYTNSQLLDKVREYDKANDLQLYWTDLSLMNEMAAVHVLTRNCKITAYYILFSYLNNLTKLDKANILELAEYTMDKIKYAINTPNISEDEIEQFIDKLIKSLSNFDNNDLFHGFNYMCKALNLDVYNIFQLKRSDTIDNYVLFYHLMLQNFNEISLTKEMSLRHLYQAYFLYLLYSQDNYPKEITNYFLQYVGYPYIDVDPKQISVLYLIKKVFVDSLYQLYHLDEYQEFVSLFIKDKNV